MISAQTQLAFADRNISSAMALSQQHLLPISQFPQQLSIPQPQQLFLQPTLQTASNLQFPFMFPWQVPWSYASPLLNNPPLNYQVGIVNFIFSEQHPP